MIIIIIWVLPEGGPATRRRARGKRLVFVIQGHHHHVHNCMIFINAVLQ
nr:MAG TPA: Triggering receptor expressed on myeloid receptor, SIGNALING PROTEIN [Caudoviricetes sp.]